MDIIYTRTDIFWTREFKNAKAISYDESNDLITITDSKGNTATAYGKESMISITFPKKEA